MFQSANVYTEKTSAAPEEKLSPEEAEFLQNMLDLFYSPTKKAAEQHKKELESSETRQPYETDGYRIKNDYIVAIEKDRYGWSGHDESWTYFDIITAEKITRKEYEQGIDSTSADDPAAPFASIAKAARECRVWHAPDNIKGLCNGSDIWWSDYAVAYITGFDALPGYYRFIYAHGKSD